MNVHFISVPEIYRGLRLPPMLINAQWAYYFSNQAYYWIDPRMRNVLYLLSWSSLTEGCCLTQTTDWRECWLHSSLYVVRLLLSLVKWWLPITWAWTTKFSPGICESKGITPTSSYIDSHGDLEINAVPEDRIRFKKPLSCAVLKVENSYSSGWVIQHIELQNISSPLYQSPGVALKLYFLGRQIVNGVHAPYFFYTSNTSSPSKYRTW